MTTWTQEVLYVVLPDATNPYLLARVRWPDVSQAISPVHTDWQADPGLFDLPYSPSGTRVTLEQATAIAAVWGAHLPSEEPGQKSGPALIRRMPADWSGLSRAEERAWSIDLLRRGKRQSGEARAPRRAPVRGRRGAADPIVIDLTKTTEPHVIDLTQTTGDALPAPEDA